MKKLLMTTLAMGLMSVNAGAVSVPSTGNATMGNTAKLDTRRPIRAVQETLLSIRPAVIASLANAESIGFEDGETATYLDADFVITTGSIVGLDDPAQGEYNPDVGDNGAITFTLSASALYPGTAFANAVNITFTPVVDQSNYQILGWNCSSAAASQNFGPSWDAPTSGANDQIAQPLGYPYYGCTVT